MSTLILDGKVVRDARKADLVTRIKGLIHVPHLAIVQVGSLSDSTAFIRAKIAFAKTIGVMVKHVALPENISQAKLIEEVTKLNTDKTIHGVIVQLPLPVSIDRDAVIDTIDPRKDCDGLTSYHLKRSVEGREDAILSATTRGVKELLEYYKIELYGKHVVVVGRSMLVGKPLATYALNENATVTVCHSKTTDLAEYTRKADILIVAVGKPNLINETHVREGTIVVDVGINTTSGDKLEEEVGKRKLVGDVDFDRVKNICGAISPVPGGVGPMTVLGLFENLVDLCTRA